MIDLHITKYQANTEEDVDYSKSYGLKGSAASAKTTPCVHQSEILGSAAESSIPAPLHLVLEPRKQRLTDLKIQI